MYSRAQQANLNIEHAREMRARGLSYRDIRRQLAISPSQISHIKRALKREKGAKTRLRNNSPDATSRDIPIRQTVLPPGLRDRLVAYGFRTLGDIADRLAEPDFAGLHVIGGLGPYKVRLITDLMDHYELLPGSDDLQDTIEHLFPELSDR